MGSVRKKPGMDGANGDAEAARKGLIGLNKLNYVLEPDLSVAINSTHKQHFFQQTSYTNETTATCILNSGADYIDPKRSYLCFTVKVGPETLEEADYKAVFSGNTDADVRTISFRGISNAADDFSETKRVAATGKVPYNTTSRGSGYLQRFAEQRGSGGSAMNLIKRVTISSRSGDEISRVDKANLLHYICEQYMYDEKWAATVGTAMGTQWSYVTPAGANYGGLNAEKKEQIEINRTIRVCIPMSCLSGFFNYDRLLPQQIMSGLRINLEWETPQNAFICGGIDNGTGVTALPLTGYSISNIYFNAYSVQLTDSIQRLLNEHSATNGLEIVFADWSNSSYPVLSGAVHAEVRQAVSRALRAVARVRALPVAAVNNQYSDSFEATRWATEQYYWQLGSLYFPHQPVKCPAYALAQAGNIANLGGAADFPAVTYKNSATEPYIQALDAMKNIQNTGTSQASVTYKEFESHAGISAVSLERSSLFNLSGIPINNARVLSYNAQMSTVYPNTTVKLSIDIFLQYVRLVRVWLTNTEVEQ